MSQFKRLRQQGAVIDLDSATPERKKPRMVKEDGESPEVPGTWGVAGVDFWTADPVEVNTDDESVIGGDEELEGLIDEVMGTEW